VSRILSAEARSRPPQYREYKRLQAAEQFAKNKLGVGEVNYGGRLDVANLCNHALFLAWQREIPMPRSVTFRPFQPGEGSPNDLAHYQPEFSDAPGHIVLNAQHPGWQDIVATMRKAREENQLSTDNPRHPMMHELGEMAMHQSVGWEAFTPGQEEFEGNEEAFEALGDAEQVPLDEQGRTPLDIVADEVSDRARENHSEFVAEVFAALMLGRDELWDNHALMQYLRQFGGDRLFDWLGEE
jgi:hypothetical protein